MLSDIQKQQLIDRQTSEEYILKQISFFKKGFDAVQLTQPATIGNGIVEIDDPKAHALIDAFDKQSQSIEILKFVPASGAATRMFKSLFEFVNEKDKSKKRSSAYSQTHLFIYNLQKFAFFNDLKIVAEKRGVDIQQLSNTDEDTILNSLLDSNGLNYGSLPKGLLKFHQYSNQSRTAFEEHLVEAALHAKGKGNIKIHFTVSPEHIDSFKKQLASVLSIYEKQFNATFEIGFSVQKPSTDTISIDESGQVVCSVDGKLLFRPGGHGALLDNLNDLDADIIFIKNIDNVVPDHLKGDTVKYKKIIGGLLLSIRAKMYHYQQLIDSKNEIDNELLKEIANFAKNDLYLDLSDALNSGNKLEVIKEFLFKPIRVCGMVKNTGEPGGGPFWLKDKKGKLSLQIVESSQVDANNAVQKEIFGKASHFNPVDLVCSTKNYKSEKYNLSKYRDDETGFITNKSIGGKEIKVQELPGLWNGSMAHWNTVFVEVPISTFNPVKTVNDLLRPEHQGI